MSQTIKLSGDALFGIAPHLLTAGQRALLPSQVRLGRISSNLGRPKVRLQHHFSEEVLTSAPPSALNRRDLVAAVIAKMYRNDLEGDCVIAALLKLLGLLSALDSDSGGTLLATDQEAHAQYVSICGPNDQGCVVDSVLDYASKRGMTLAGKSYPIDGFVHYDWTDQLLTQAAIYVMGGTLIGFNLPAAWQNSSVWDVTSSRIVGGHCVLPVDYGPDGVTVASWGRLYLITWRAWQSRRYIEEAQAVLAPKWYGRDQIASAVGFNVGRLKQALGLIGQGQVPPLDPPAPPPPPPPPPAGFMIPAKGNYECGVDGNGALTITYQ